LAELLIRFKEYENAKMSYWKSEERRWVRPSKRNNLGSVLFSKFIARLWGRF
jgi:hypothetical protein